MDIKSELDKYMPPAWRGLLGLGAGLREPFEPVDLTIMFTDIDNYAAITDEHGDRRSHNLVGRHNRIVRRALRHNGGHEVKHTGDGIMSYFLSAARAIECAIEIQREVAESNLEGKAPELHIAIGLNTGAPVFEDGDLFGTAVITAARVTDAARGDEILASEVVRLLAAGKGFTFLPRGRRLLEGQREPVGLFEVDWHRREAAALEQMEEVEQGAVKALSSV